MRDARVDSSRAWNLLTEVIEKLSCKPWFASEGWRTSLHDFPDVTPTCVTLHIFKDGWFNSQRQGIHIETFVWHDVKKCREINLTFHLLHEELVPGTNIKRKVFAQLIVDEIGKSINNWKGWEARAGKYGVQPYTFRLNGLDPSISTTLVEEITRLCQTLGPVVDNAIVELTNSAPGKKVESVQPLSD